VCGYDACDGDATARWPRPRRVMFDVGRARLRSTAWLATAVIGRSSESGWRRAASELSSSALSCGSEDPLSAALIRVSTECRACEGTDVREVEGPVGPALLSEWARGSAGRLSANQHALVVAGQVEPLPTTESESRVPSSTQPVPT
jgi:hypothetical protein